MQPASVTWQHYSLLLFHDSHLKSKQHKNCLIIHGFILQNTEPAESGCKQWFGFWSSSYTKYIKRNRKRQSSNRKKRKISNYYKCTTLFFSTYFDSTGYKCFTSRKRRNLPKQSPSHNTSLCILSWKVMAIAWLLNTHIPKQKKYLCISRSIWLLIKLLIWW